MYGCQRTSAARKPENGGTDEERENGEERALDFGYKTGVEKMLTSGIDGAEFRVTGGNVGLKGECLCQYRM